MIDLAAVQLEPGFLADVVVYGGFGGGFVQHGVFLGRLRLWPVSGGAALFCQPGSIGATLPVTLRSRLSR